EYVPFVREGVKWVYTIQNEPNEFYPNYDVPQGTSSYTLELKGDTIINGKAFKAMHKYHGDVINWENDTIPVYLREENHVVYGIVLHDQTYADCPIGVCGFWDVFEQIHEGNEFVLYDFNAPIASWNARFTNGEEDEFKALYTDTIIAGSHLLKKHVYERIPGKEFSIIEAIGFDSQKCTGYTLFPNLPLTIAGTDALFRLSHVVEDGQIIYKGMNYKEPEADGYGYLPIPREGVRWVNEKVIVNNGDTTCYYYNYEFSGKDSVYTNTMNEVYDACYYFLGNDLNVEQDSLIAGLRDYYLGLGATVCLRNDAYNKVRSENRQLFDLFLYLDGGSRKLYDFRSSGGGCIHYYLMCEYYWCLYGGFEEEVTEENLIEIEPLTIEGVNCSRIAYLDEQGEPLAYVVEGIGFDSRDMGDLLTPFTRRPDPDADYQEWCGLSHVVKDGQIIYKGMRYRHGAFTGIDEVVADKTLRPLDPHYYDLMGRSVGTEVPTAPGIYIHQGKKIVVR
ncbi:MAG: hypothetical protein J6S96_07695, partial [Muribaculaceae bacterium]|nr:hypothetical protein [Muribaculaceae bacterium]